MPKNVFDMNVNELQEFVQEQRRIVRGLRRGSTSSPEYRYERSILNDAEQLLAKRTAPPKAEPAF